MTCLPPFGCGEGIR